MRTAFRDKIINKSIDLKKLCCLQYQRVERRNFLLCGHLFINSVRLLREVFSSAFRIIVFSRMQSLQYLLIGLYAGALPTFAHDISNFFFFSFRSQMYFDKLVEYCLLILLNEEVWFAYLSLNVVAVRPI